MRKGLCDSLAQSQSPFTGGCGAGPARKVTGVSGVFAMNVNAGPIRMQTRDTFPDIAAESLLKSSPIRPPSPRRYQ